MKLFKYDGKLSTRKKITKILGFIDLRSDLMNGQGEHFVEIGLDDDILLSMAGIKELERLPIKYIFDDE